MESIAGRWEKYDMIDNRVQVFDIRGGGMGVVYIGYDYIHQTPIALKTFREELLISKEAQALFEKEALVWIKLESHPNIVYAHLVQKLEERLFIFLEYIAPDIEGRNTLTHYIESLSYPEILKFSIQFCYGMEHAYSKGIDAHRDIKPDNIMITPDNTVKITDFGLVKAFSEIELNQDITPKEGTTGLSIFRIKGKRICGTWPWMAPEQFNGVADQRSDIYSFGIVMYQMAARGKLPFIASSLHEFENLHNYEEVPSLSHPLFPLIRECLEKNPDRRFQDFASLREKIQDLLVKETGKRIEPPEVKDIDENRLFNKGLALNHLNRDDEAISCYDKILEKNQMDAGALTQKGISLNNLGKYNEAISCFDKTLKIEPGDTVALSGKGNVLANLDKYEDAISYYDKALNMGPNAYALYNKGLALFELGRYKDAIACYDEALEISPWYAPPWNNKGFTLISLGRIDEALSCLNHALEINPGYTLAYVNKGLAFENLKRYDDAISCYDKALEIDSRDAKALNNKGSVFGKLGRYQEAISFFEKALEINPNFDLALRNKGSSLFYLGRYEEAVFFLNKAIQVNPKDTATFCIKGFALSALGRYVEALKCVEEAIKTNPDFSQACQLKRLILQKIQAENCIEDIK